MEQFALILKEVLSSTKKPHLKHVINEFHIQFFWFIFKFYPNYFVTNSTGCSIHFWQSFLLVEFESTLYIQQCTHCIIKWVDKSEIQKAYMKRTFAVHWHLNSILNCFLTVMRVMFVEYFPNVVPFFNEIILGCLFSKLSQMAFRLISNINYLGCFKWKNCRE